MITEFEKEKVFWTRKMNLKLVKFIESRPNIWNPKHPKYTSIEIRDQTYNEFASKYGNEFTGQAVKERWTNIRSTFANYLRKVRASQQNVNGEEYRVNWNLWEPCQFLMKINKRLKTSTSKEEYFEEDINGDVGMQELEENWSTEEDNYFENNDIGIINESTQCNRVAEKIVEILNNTQHDSFGFENTRNCKIGKIVSKKLSQKNSYEAAIMSKKIMDILLLYDENNPMNPNNSIKHNDLNA